MAVVLINVILIATAAYAALPVTFRPVVLRKLTPQVISINDIPTGSFYCYDRNHPANLTIVVEVTWNNWKPVKGTGVTIYGSVEATDTSTTDSNGLAVLRMPFSPLPFGNRTYFSMIVWKDNHLLTKEDAISIYYKNTQQLYNNDS